MKLIDFLTNRNTQTNVFTLRLVTPSYESTAFNAPSNDYKNSCLCKDAA